MKSVVWKICRVALSILWRLALTAVLLAAIAVIGAGMVLSAVFNGPSETARDQLTAIMLEYDATRSIPSYFLSQDTIDAICAAEDILPAEASDPSLIEPDPSTGTDDAFALAGRTYTATVQLFRDPQEVDHLLAGTDNYADFSEDGILMVASSVNEAAAIGISDTCGKILIMDGQVNYGLFNSNSGYAARSAIGQRADGTAILVNINGGTKECPGGTWQDLINILTEYGAVNACSITVSEE